VTERATSFTWYRTPCTPLMNGAGVVFTVSVMVKSPFPSVMVTLFVYGYISLTAIDIVQVKGSET